MLCGKLENTGTTESKSSEVRRLWIITYFTMNLPSGEIARMYSTSYLQINLHCQHTDQEIKLTFWLLNTIIRQYH